MFRGITRIISTYDFLLLFSVMGLLCFGFLGLYSVGLGKDPQSFTYLFKQAVFLFAAIPVLLFFSFLNYRFFKNIAIPLYAGVIFLLTFVLFIGHTVRGTKGWIFLGQLGIQPAEFAKIALIFMLAWYFSHHARRTNKLQSLLMSGLLAGVPIALILVQPDFGSAVVLFSIWIGLIFVSGIPRKYTFSLILITALLAVSSWFFLFKPYQKDRIRTFIFPASDQRGSGYNVEQAKIAIGAGRLFGRGLGAGSQSHLKFLPETQTDFIFSVIAEELGFVGVTAIFILWLIFFYRLTRLMKRVRDDFALYSVLGVALLFLSQMVLNVGGNLGVVPLTGLVLPFMSYGGSALLIMLLAVAFVESIYAYSV